MDLSGPFRGSLALLTGSLTRGVLYGPRYRRVFPDIHAPADLELDLLVRSRAAALLVEGEGVLSGWSAAELLHASCGPPNAPAEVTLPSGQHRRPLSGLVVHRDALCDDELVTVCGHAVTSPLRTAFDLARWRDRLDAIVAVDALAYRHGFDPGDLRSLRSRHLGAPGTRGLDDVLALADARAESPMETRIRLALVWGGLAAPAVQHPVVVGGRSFRLDLAYPAARLGIEYDGREHRTPERAVRDLEREALLAAAGWKILRFDAVTVHRPRVVAAAVRTELAHRRS
jgi:very-short-patch-repair endonuclease